jgi:predicted regulator of Ras-like GTPase activity (Roadblock/LC7/MglB family)
MNACLTVSTTANAKLGLIFLDMKRAAEKVASMI